MRFREVATGSRHPRAVAAVVLGALAIGVSACGEDDFENESRPPSPIEITAAIDDRSVSVSPSEFGAGLVTITISNQTDEPTTLTLVGPSDEESPEIPAGGTGSIKANLAEGDYEASAGASSTIKTQTVKVGPERESAQNDLLLP